MSMGCYVTLTTHSPPYTKTESTIFTNTSTDRTWTALAAFADAGLEFIPSFFLNFHKDVSAGLSRFVGVTICDSLLSILKDYFFFVHVN